MKWPSTLGRHICWTVDEKILGDLLMAVIRVSNGTVRKQAIRSADPVHSVLATSWSNKGWWAVMSCIGLGEPDCYGRGEKNSFLDLARDFQKVAVPWTLRGRDPQNFHHSWQGVSQRTWRLHSHPNYKERMMFKATPDSRTSRTCVHCNSFGVTAEGSNVFLDPLQCETLYGWSA